MKPKRKQDLTLRCRFSYWWMAPGTVNAWLCNDTVQRKIALPPEVRDIRLEASKRPSANSFEMFVNKSGNMRFKEFPRTDLMFSMEHFMRGNFKDGYKYIRVTYVTPRK